MYVYSDIQTNDAGPLKYVPFGYFRSYSYQPVLAYPPYNPSAYNPYFNWQHDLYSSYPRSSHQSIGHQSFYSAAAASASSEPGSSSYEHRIQSTVTPPPLSNSMNSMQLTTAAIKSTQPERKTESLTTTTTVATSKFVKSVRLHCY